MNIFGLLAGYSVLKGNKQHKKMIKSSKKGLFLVSDIVVEISQLLAILICSLIKGIWLILNQIYRTIKNPSQPIMVVDNKKQTRIKKAKVIKLSDYREKKKLS